jgi:hypothetical protein
MSKAIITELENLKSNYDKSIEIVDGLSFKQKDLIRTIEFYSNSKYLNGQKDELGRDKPFFQILNAICDVENTAKDLDTKDISITSDDGNHYLESWLLSKDIQVWMKDVNFAKILNDMRDMHTRYGSLLVKKVVKKDKNGEKQLYFELPEWKNVMNDQVDMTGGAIVEVHWMTPIEISKMTEWHNIDQVLEKFKGTTGKRIPVYEIRGEFSKAVFKNCDGKKYGPKDEKEFSYQLYYVVGNPTDANKKTDGYIPLYWEDDTDKVYKYLARKPKAGRAFGCGVFEEGEEAQVWTNDAVLKQYRAMEYTSKVIAQSASKKLKGRNLLTETDDGTILEVEDGKPIESLQLLPSGGLTQYQNLIAQWYDQLEKTTSAYSAQRGDTPPSGTPFRLQATVLQQSSSVFKTLQQELGIFITELFDDWVMPFLATKLNREHILAYEFSPEELKEIDHKFSTKEAIGKAIEMILSGKEVYQDDFDKYYEMAQELVKVSKGQRFISIPKDFYKNLKAKITVNITGEQRNKAATLESLNNILTVYASNPGLANDPVASQLLFKIIELSGAGISPVQITGAIAEKNRQDTAMKEAQAKMQPQEGGNPKQQPKPLSLNASGGKVPV